MTENRFDTTAPTIEPLDIHPPYITERFLYDQQAPLNSAGLATDFSKGVITALFGYDEAVLAAGLLFIEKQNAAIGSAFAHLWEAVFTLCRDWGLVKDRYDSVPYTAVFNHQIGQRLVQKAEQLVVRETLCGDTAEITFQSCMPTQGFRDFEGYANFDFIAALSVLRLKDKYPHLNTVKANVYFSSGVPLKTMDFPVTVESTIDQRFIYGLINSR